MRIKTHVLVFGVEEFCHPKTGWLLPPDHQDSWNLKPGLSTDST